MELLYFLRCSHDPGDIAGDLFAFASGWLLSLTTLPGKHSEHQSPEQCVVNNEAVFFCHFVFTNSKLYCKDREICLSRSRER